VFAKRCNSKYALDTVNAKYKHILTQMRASRSMFESLHRCGLGIDDTA